MPTIARRIPELTLVEHEVTVPLDHSGERAETLTVFARELIGAQRGSDDLPYLVFLQGGPGFESPRQTAAPAVGTWLERALRDYRVLLLDQRGTGRSSPIGSLPGLTPERALPLEASGTIPGLELVEPVQSESGLLHPGA